MGIDHEISVTERLAKSAREQLAGHESYLVTLRAKKAQEIEAAKTVGQRMAETLVTTRGCAAYEDSFWVGRSPVDGLFLTAPDLAMTQGVGQLREEFAAAINKAVAEEREACAMLVYNAHSDTSLRGLRDAIRARE